MQQYVGQITLVAFTFAPVDWAFCDGSLLQISQFQALFTLIGTTYGGDGINTFALPDLRGRIPLHQGQGTGLSPYVMGQVAGSETVTLNVLQIPAHTHQAQGVAATGNSTGPSGAVWAGTKGDKPYVPGVVGEGNMAGGAIGPAGGNQPHPNIMAYQAINYIIALNGVFPSQS
jgi:microcystin-dependent protein